MANNEKNNLKQYYSCKRKPDIVTGIAIGLFLVMILMQVYLVVFLPIQLREGETLAYNVARDKVLQHVDKLRMLSAHAKPRGRLAEGECKMTTEAFNRLMLYAREHREQLDLAQITELAQRFQQFDFIIKRWYEKPPQFVLTEEKIDQRKYVRMLEKRIQDQETLSQ